MDPFPVANTPFAMYEIENHNSSPTSDPMATVDEEVKSAERSSGNTEDKAKRQNLIGKLSALAKIPITEWKDWRSNRTEAIPKESQQTKADASSGVLKLKPKLTWLQRGCSCGPFCFFERAARETKELERAEEAAIATAEKLVHDREKPQFSIPRKSSKQKNKDKGKGKETDTARTDDPVAGHNTPEQGPSDKEEKKTITLPPQIAWHPEFQSKPPPPCNCLVFRNGGDGFSDEELRKMYWFVKRMQRGLAVPDDWAGDVCQSAWQEYNHRVFTRGCLREQGFLNLSPAIEALRNSRRIRIPTRHSEEKVSASREALLEYLIEESRLERLELEIDTSVRGDDLPGNTPNNSPQTLDRNSALD